MCSYDIKVGDKVVVKQGILTGMKFLVLGVKAAEACINEIPIAYVRSVDSSFTTTTYCHSLKKISDHPKINEKDLEEAFI